MNLLFDLSDPSVWLVLFMGYFWHIVALIIILIAIKIAFRRQK
jgi:hypothetical protein